MSTPMPQRSSRSSSSSSSFTCRMRWKSAAALGCPSPPSPAAGSAPSPSPSPPRISTSPSPPSAAAAASSCSGRGVGGEGKVVTVAWRLPHALARRAASPTYHPHKVPKQGAPASSCSWCAPPGPEVRRTWRKSSSRGADTYSISTASSSAAAAAWARQGGGGGRWWALRGCNGNPALGTGMHSRRTQRKTESLSSRQIAACATFAASFLAATPPPPALSWANHACHCLSRRDPPRAWQWRPGLLVPRLAPPCTDSKRRAAMTSAQRTGGAARRHGGHCAGGAACAVDHRPPPLTAQLSAAPCAAWPWPSSAAPCWAFPCHSAALLRRCRPFLARRSPAARRAACGGSRPDAWAVWPCAGRPERSARARRGMGRVSRSATLCKPIEGQSVAMMKPRMLGRIRGGPQALLRGAGRGGRLRLQAFPRRWCIRGHPSLARSNSSRPAIRLRWATAREPPLMFAVSPPRAPGTSIVRSLQTVHPFGACSEAVEVWVVTCTPPPPLVPLTAACTPPCAPLHTRRPRCHHGGFLAHPGGHQQPRAAADGCAQAGGQPGRGASAALGGVPRGRGHEGLLQRVPCNMHRRGGMRLSLPRCRFESAAHERQSSSTPSGRQAHRPLARRRTCLDADPVHSPSP